jgi:hypothetical protein
MVRGRHRALPALYADAVVREPPRCKPSGLAVRLSVNPVEGFTSASDFDVRVGLW